MNRIKDFIAKQTYLALAVVFILGVVVGAGGYWLNSDEINQEPIKEEVSQNNEENQQANLAANKPAPLSNSGSLSVQDQIAGSIIKIANVSLENPGWIAIHESDDGAPRKTAFGARWLPEGTHNDVIVETLRPTVADKSYFASLRNDDGDKKYNSETDEILKDTAGNNIVVKFSVTPGNAAPQTSTNSNTTSTESSI